MKRLIEDIFATDDDEIQCEEAGITMARCAGANLAETESRQQYPRLWRHFRFCPNCEAEYAMLMTLVQLEAETHQPQGQISPPLPDDARPPIWQWAKEAILGKFPGFTSSQMVAVTRGDNVIFEPVLVSLADGVLEIEFDLTINEDDASRRDLFCTLSAAAETLAAHFEGTTVWLQLDDQGPVSQTQTVSEFGDVTFTSIAPGGYSFRLRLGHDEYGVSGIMLP